MKTHAKVWLWIMLIADILTILTYIPLLRVHAFYAAFMVMGAAMIVSVCLMLFKRLKLGFYLLCGISVIIFFLNLYAHVSLLVALVGMLGAPIITYLFIKSSWDSLS